MKYYSQIDPAYSAKLLPLSNLRIRGYGCLLCSLATLGQGELLDLLKVPGAFAQGGLAVSGVIAKAMGMFYVGPSTTAPKGWCIGRTDKYAAQGFPTHFLCVNVDTNEMIDPLKFPARIEPLTYKINQYRVFTGVKLVFPPPPPVFEAPVDPALPDWAQDVARKAQQAGIKTPLTQSLGDMPIYQALLLIEKYMSVK